MNKHEVISRVYDHLMTQQEKSIQPARRPVDVDECMYRQVDSDGNQLACAIGALIDDECYHSNIEHHGAYHEPVLDALIASGIDVSIQATDMKFLSDLQDVHDSQPIKSWSEKLEKLADEWNL